MKRKDDSQIKTQDLESDVGSIPYSSTDILCEFGPVDVGVTCINL